MATITRGGLPDLYLNRLANLDAIIYGRHEIPLQMMQLYNVMQGSGSFMNETTVSGFGTVPVKGEGAASALDQLYQGFDKKYTPVVYSLMYSISKEAMDDQQDIQIAKNAKALERSFRSTQETILAADLNTGFDTATAADGYYIFDADRTLAAGGTWQNTLTTAADLSVTSLQTALNDYADTVDDRGLLLNLVPGRLVVPMELSWLATEILKSSLRSDTANNAINAFNPMDIVVINYLTDADAWFLFPKSNADHDLKFIEWEKFQTYADMEFKTDDLLYKGRQRYAHGITDPRGLYGSPGA